MYGAGEGNRTLDNSLEGCGFTTKLHPHVIKIFNFEFVYARVMPLQLLSLLRDGFTLRGNSQPIRQKYCSWLWFYHSPAHALYFVDKKYYIKVPITNQPFF
jgi:hypothetical protein